MPPGEGAAELPKSQQTGLWAAGCTRIHQGSAQGVWSAQELHPVGTGWNSAQPPHGCGAAGRAVTQMGLICWERRGVCIAFLVARWFKSLMTSRHYPKGSGPSKRRVFCFSLRGKKKQRVKPLCKGNIKQKPLNLD